MRETISTWCLLYSESIRARWAAEQGDFSSLSPLLPEVDVVVHHGEPSSGKTRLISGFLECCSKMALGCQLSLRIASVEENCLAQGHSGSSSFNDWSTWGLSEFPSSRSNSGQLWRATPVPEHCQGAIWSLCWSAPPLAPSLPQMFSPKAFLDINHHLRVCFLGNPTCDTLHLALVWRGPMQQLASSGAYGYLGQGGLSSCKWIWSYMILRLNVLKIKNDKNKLWNMPGVSSMGRERTGP